MRKFRLSEIAALTIGALVLLPACGDDSTSPDQNPTDNRTLREIRDVDYVRNRFFFFDTPDFFTGPAAVGIRVYRTVTAQDLVDDPTIDHSTGWAVPDPDGWGFPMHNIVIVLNNGQQPTNAIQHEFTLLTELDDYTLIRDSQSGAIVGFALEQAIPDAEMRSIAVSYTSVDGWVVGGTYQQLGVQPSAPGYAAGNLLLEMIKAPDPDPQGTFAATWPLEMRHVYDLGSTRITRSTLEITVVDILTLPANPSPAGSSVPYLLIFGLDQSDAAGTGPSDGVIDLSGGRVDLIKGLLYFPAVEAFRPDPVSVDTWTDGAFSFAGQYAAQYDSSLAIYNEELDPTRATEVHQYVIQVLAE